MYWLCITNLSRWDPKMRMTPQEAMQHKWILEGRRNNHNRTHDQLRHEPKDSTGEPSFPKPGSGPLIKRGHKALLCEERLARLRNVYNPLKISTLKPLVKHPPWSGDITLGRKEGSIYIVLLLCTVVYPSTLQSYQVQSYPQPPVECGIHLDDQVQTTSFSFHGRIMISWLLMIGWYLTSTTASP